MECFFDVIDDITNMLQDLTLPFKKLGGNLAAFSSRVTGPYLKNYFEFVYCSLKV